MQGCQCLRVFQQKRKPALFDSPVASADAGIELSLNDFFLQALGATPGKLAVQPIDRRDPSTACSTGVRATSLSASSRKPLASSSNGIRVRSSGVNNKPLRLRDSPLLDRLSQTVVGAASARGTDTGNDHKKNIGSRVQAKADQALPMISPGRCRIAASRQPVSSVRFWPPTQPNV